MAQTTLEHLESIHRPAAKPAETQQPNIERAVAVAGGGSLIALGLLGRSGWSRLTLAVAGLALTYRGLTGRSLLSGRKETKHYGTSHAASKMKARRGFRFETAMTIQRSPEELFRAWRDLENLPVFLEHLHSVRDTGVGKSHWIAHGPVGNVEWDAEIISERPNELLAWQSLPGSTLDTAGSVRFDELFPKDRGTVVRILLQYDPPGGGIVESVARLFGSGFEHSVREDLRRFKQIMEAGEVPTTAGQPSGMCGKKRKGGAS